jgi:hypothetical protein
MASVVERGRQTRGHARPARTLAGRHAVHVHIKPSTTLTGSLHVSHLSSHLASHLASLPPHPWQPRLAPGFVWSVEKSVSLVVDSRGTRLCIGELLVLANIAKIFIVSITPRSMVSPRFSSVLI